MTELVLVSGDAALEGGGGQVVGGVGLERMISTTSLPMLLSRCRCCSAMLLSRVPMSFIADTTWIRTVSSAGSLACAAAVAGAGWNAAADTNDCCCAACETSSAADDEYIQHTAQRIHTNGT